MASLDQFDHITVTVEAAASLLGISRGYAYQLARERRLPGVRKLGRRYVVVSRELKDWLGLDPASQ
jgi:excisionase family DNA binding protein